MDVDVLFAGIPVSDFSAAQSWYERFFGRPPDVVAHETEVLWRISDSGWLYIVGDEQRAGSSIAALLVPDIEAATAKIAARGVTIGPIEPEGDAGRKSVTRDPDGNELALIQVTG